MKRAQFTSKNLMGDALNISLALRAWYEQHRDWNIDLFTLPDHIAPIYERMGVPLTVYTKWDDEFDAPDFKFNFDVGIAFALGEQTHKHISACYADILGVDIGNERKPVYIPFEEPHEKGLILISLFSRSCSSQTGGPPNKMLPWDKSARIIELLRQAGPIGILGAEGDRVPIFRNESFNIVENEYYTGLSLNKVALMLRDSKAVFTIDNGISHLAASQDAKEIVFYPECLDPRWIAPLGNRNAVIIHGNPVTIQLPGFLKVIRDTFMKWGLL
jgi:Glycosyltransferase family 9 (heptosyltransferase)